MRIYVTGIGTVNAVGCNVEETLHSLSHGISGISSVEYLETIYNSMPVGEVKRTNRELAQMAGVDTSQNLVRTPLLGVIAAREAVSHAGIGNVGGLRMAFVSGTTVGGMDVMERYYDDFTHNDSKNAFLYPHDIGDSSEYIADHIGGFSYVTSISTACSSGANAIILGAELIKSGRFDIVVAGGAESLSRYHFNGFNTLKILDSEHCRPFDASRAGLNLGEGAGYVVLESGNAVALRHSTPLCVLSGYANACDAFHQTATSDNGEGPYLAMSKAIESANLKPSDITYINAHGTGTPNNDLTESVALRRVFNDTMPLVSSTKAYTGHATSAAGAIEAVFAVMCVKYGFCPANLNFQNPIPETGIVPLTANVQTDVNHVLSNSFGFGGNDSSLIFSKL